LEKEKVNGVSARYSDPLPDFRNQSDLDVVLKRDHQDMERRR
jgi:hypothetical protein